MRRQLLEERHARVAALGEHEDAAAGVLERDDEGAQLLLVGEARGHRHAALAVVGGRGAGREADRAGAHRLEHQPAHFGDLGIGCNALRRRLAQHVAAQRRVPDEARDVERRPPALEHVEVLRHRFELPADAASQRVQRHALDLGQVAHHALAVRGAARRDGEAAVADHGGGDAKRGRGRGARIPGELRVVMRVVVDDPRHQGQAAGVNCFFCAVLDFPDFRNAAVLDTHVSMPGRRTRTVEQQRAADHEVVHGGESVYWRAMELRGRVAAVDSGYLAR